MNKEKNDLTTNREPGLTFWYPSGFFFFFCFSLTKYTCKVHLCQLVLHLLRCNMPPQSLLGSRLLLLSLSGHKKKKRKEVCTIDVYVCVTVQCVSYLKIA